MQGILENDENQIELSFWHIIPEYLKYLLNPNATITTNM